MQQVLQTHLNQYDRFFEGHAKESEVKYRKGQQRVSTTRKMSRPPVATTPITIEEDLSRSNAPASNVELGFSSPTQDTVVDDDEIELCETMDKVIYPTSATSETGVGLFIFNSDDHKQGVHVSICQSVEKPCDDFVILRNNYRSMCKQTKIFRELLSLSPEGNPIKERFEFPASCTCVLKRVVTN